MPFGNMGGWTFVIILVIVLLLFGAPRLPKLAKSLGESMRIFKGEMKTMKTESGGRSAPVTETRDATPTSTSTSTESNVSDVTNRTSPDLPSDGNDTQAR